MLGRCNNGVFYSADHQAKSPNRRIQTANTAELIQRKTRWARGGEEVEGALWAAVGKEDLGEGAEERLGSVSAGEVIGKTFAFNFSQSSRVIVA